MDSILHQFLPRDYETNHIRQSDTILILMNITTEEPHCPCCGEFVLQNINHTRFFLSFLKIKVALLFEIIRHARQGSAYPA